MSITEKEKQDLKSLISNSWLMLTQSELIKWEGVVSRIDTVEPLFKAGVKADINPFPWMPRNNAIQERDRQAVIEERLDALEEKFRRLKDGL